MLGVDVLDVDTTLGIHTLHIDTLHIDTLHITTLHSVDSSYIAHASFYSPPSSSRGARGRQAGPSRRESKVKQSRRDVRKGV